MWHRELLTRSHLWLLNSIQWIVFGEQISQTQSQDRWVKRIGWGAQNHKSRLGCEWESRRWSGNELCKIAESELLVPRIQEACRRLWSCFLNQISKVQPLDCVNRWLYTASLIANKHTVNLSPALQWTACRCHKIALALWCHARLMKTAAKLRHQPKAFRQEAAFA